MQLLSLSVYLDEVFSVVSPLTSVIIQHVHNELYQQRVGFFYPGFWLTGDQYVTPDSSCVLISKWKHSDFSSGTPASNAPIFSLSRSVTPGDSKTEINPERERESEKHWLCVRRSCEIKKWQNESRRKLCWWSERKEESNLEKRFSLWSVQVFLFQMRRHQSENTVSLEFLV